MNTFGQKLRITTFGESHGNAIGCVIDGLPAGLQIDKSRISQELERRKGGKTLYTTQRKERDQVEILSGIFEDKTTGTPLAMIFYNQDTKSRDYENIKDIFRPAHADFTYFHKYGIRDYRGGGRSSARESVARVGAGAIAKILLEHFGIFTESGIEAIGDIQAQNHHFDFAKKSEIFSLDPDKELEQKDLITKTKHSHDSVGGVALVRARGKIPIGLGEGLYNKLDGAIASMMMGLNGVKAVEIGSGIKASKMKGSQHNDPMNNTGFLSNHHGGILGGMSSGEEIIVRIHFKPTPSIFLEQETQNIHAQSTTIKLTGRHDPCIAVRGSIICEHMLSLILADMLLLNASATLKSLEKIYL